jgi:hypothetical protein
MILKKYVLLKNKMLLDKDKSNKIYFDYGKDIARYWYVVNKGHEYALRDEDIIKTSDNILDFIDVGDLIETSKTIIRVDGITYLGAFETLASREYSDVKAFYKRQPNGDYKKYKVKED